MSIQNICRDFPPFISPWTTQLRTGAEPKSYTRHIVGFLFKEYLFGVDSRVYMIIDKYDVLHREPEIPLILFPEDTKRCMCTHKGILHNLYVMSILLESLDWGYNLKERFMS